MFHAGLAFELSRIIWADRRTDAGRGRPTHDPSRRRRPDRASAWIRVNRALEPGRLAAPLSAVEDPWWRWRVVEPDAEYLRRRAA